MKHLPHYLSLIGIFILGFLGFWWFSYDRLFQLVIIVAVAFSYIVWGVVHHHVHKDLSLEVVMEYIFIAILGIVLMASLVLQA